MSTLGRLDGNSRVRAYRNRIERIMSQLDRNLESMHLENANRRRELEEIAADIRLECTRALNGLDSITFE